jgi:hypothetical protein
MLLDVPFISVDTYTDGTNAYFGELTSTPGGPYQGIWVFSDEFDTELGTYYRLGYRRRGWDVPVVTGLPPVLRKRRDAEQKQAMKRGRKDVLSPDYLRTLVRKALRATGLRKPSPPDRTK